MEPGVQATRGLVKVLGNSDLVRDDRDYARRRRALGVPAGALALALALCGVAALPRGLTRGRRDRQPLQQWWDLAGLNKMPIAVCRCLQEAGCQGTFQRCRCGCESR